MSDTLSPSEILERKKELEFLHAKYAQQDFQNLDTETGAPMKVRLAVALAKTPEDRLATIRKFYPDARVRLTGGWSVQDGISKYIQPEEIVIFKDPKTGRKTSFNPLRPVGQGADAGMLDYVRPVARTAASAIAGIGAAGAGPVASGAAAVGASQVTDAALNALGEQLGTVDERTIGQRITDRVIDAGIEGAGTAVGGLAFPTAAQGAKASYNAARKLYYEAGGVGKPDILSDLAAEGISTRGAAPLVTDSKTIQGTFHALSKYPGAATKIRNAVNETYQGISDFFERTAGKFGTIEERSMAGESIQSGINSWVKRTKIIQHGHEELLTKEIGSKTPVLMTNTSKLLREGMGDLENTPDTAGMMFPSEYIRLKNDISGNGGMLDWDFVRRFRSRIGEKGSSGKIVGTDMTEGDYDRLYGALTQDMQAAAKQKGPAAEAAFERTQTFWRQRQETAGKIKTILNQPFAQDAFASAVQGSDKGAEKLIEIKRLVSPDQWRDVVSVMLREMASETGGGGTGVEKLFSPRRFITNWRNTPDSVKNVFYGQVTPERQALDRLARISSAVAEFGTMGNPSGTAGQNIFMDFIGASGTTAVTGWMFPMLGVAKKTATALMSGRQADLITDPKFIEWLALGQAIDPMNFKGTAAQLGRLTGIAATQPNEVRLAIMDFLKSAFQPTPEESAGQPSGPDQGTEPRKQAMTPRGSLKEQFIDQTAALRRQKQNIDALPSQDRNWAAEKLKNDLRDLERFNSASRQIDKLEKTIESTQRSTGLTSSEKRARIDGFNRAIEGFMRQTLLGTDRYVDYR